MNPTSFPISLVREDNGGYSVSCPVLPGCHGQGETIEQAIENIREAIELTLEDMAAHHEPLPDSTRVLTTMVTVNA